MTNKMHFCFNLDAYPMHSPFRFVHLTHQNLSGRALFCHNSLAKVNMQLLIYNTKTSIRTLKIIFLSTVNQWSPCKYSAAKDIERSSWNFYTARNGVVSHEAPIGGIRLFADHTRGNRRKQNTSTIFGRRVAFHACLSLRSDRCTYAPVRI